jgi:glutamyl-tRNA reductase
MLSGLKLINLPPSAEINSTACALGNVFVLKTCQRTLVVGFNQGPNQVLPFQQLPDHRQAEVTTGLEAYSFLLETICGLKSSIIGENEIVHQFKEAYQQFCQGENPNSHVKSLLEKLFKDAKDIRSSYLLELGLMTYAGIVRKIAGETRQREILIFGSGNLTEDIVKICARKYSIVVCARNQERSKYLEDNYNIETLSWNERQTAQHSPLIVNTIGTEDLFLNETFFQSWKESHDRSVKVVDLAEPSPFSQWKDLHCQDSIMLLEDIFKKAEGLDSSRESKIREAHQAINTATLNRDKNFTINLPFGWDELQFA